MRCFIRGRPRQGLGDRRLHPVHLGLLANRRRPRLALVRVAGPRVGRIHVQVQGALPGRAEATPRNAEC